MAEVRSLPGYKLHRVLGRGNTSMVYVATDPDGREVAVKLPHEQTLHAQDAAERFGNEVRLTLKFRHPHLVRGYAGTPFGEQAFLALQYYPKSDLNEQLVHMRESRLPTPKAMRVLTDIAAALVYLHGQGAVHQDVKPHNVYIDSQGRAALGDLGSTYFVAQGGKVSGSPFYMAPEIYHGESSSAASDIYSLGVMAYELLCGERPFRGGSYEELMVAHLTRFPTSLSQLDAEVPRATTRLIEQAMAKRALDRPVAHQLYLAFAQALGEVPTELAAPAEPVLPESHLPAKLVGRHGPNKPAPGSPAGQAQDKPEKGDPAPTKARGWNPFKRKSGPTK